MTLETITAPPSAPTTPEPIPSEIASLAASSSLEMSAHRAGDVATLAARLPSGTRVYVNHLSGHSLHDSLAALRALHLQGLDPVPHLAARRITASRELRDFLTTAVREAGVSKVLLIGGDPTDTAGPYEDSASVLRERMLADCGVREVGLAGYPEGHPRIPRPTLDAALSEKLDLAGRQGLAAHIVTQFSFAPVRIVEYCADLARRAPTTPVYVGIAAPTDPATLLRYAQRCGVSASLRALRAQGMALVRAVTHTDPTEQLIPLARYCASHPGCNVVGVHFFSFGAAMKAADCIVRLLAAGTTSDISRRAPDRGAGLR